MYLYIKAIHVLAIFAFIAGTFALALACRAVAMHEKEGNRKHLFPLILHWDSVVTVPALACVWGAGLTMASGGGWGGALWLIFKLIAVVFLSCLHGVEGFLLKRFVTRGTSINRAFKLAPAAVVVCFVWIVWLAVIKPF